MNRKNTFLLAIGCQARKNRQQFWDEYDFYFRPSTFQGQPEGGLWFRTQGCTYDFQGGCLMCDYSAGGHTSAADMVMYVENGLRQITGSLNQLLVSPSGSMLDPNEVPETALKGILSALKKTHHGKFSFETRAESINENIIDTCKKYLGERFYRLFIGLECANNWILKYCVNKQLFIDEFSYATRILKSRNIKTAANILISIPFLTEWENVYMAVQSVKWAVNSGAEECFLFPTHVKESTPLHTLYEEKMFSPPALWSLIEIIRRLGPFYYEHIRLSWYTSYGAYNVLASPGTCPECYEEVIRHLDNFAQYPSQSYANALFNIKCGCKTEWYKWLENKANGDTSALLARVKNGYKTLAKRYSAQSIDAYALENIFAEMDRDAELCLFPNIFSDG